MSEILFSTGQIVGTPGALEAMENAQVDPVELLERHLYGDWGDLCPEDSELNDSAVQSGGRIMSSYMLPIDVKIWIITEWDRSATTLLLPSEY